MTTCSYHRYGVGPYGIGGDQFWRCSSPVAVNGRCYLHHVDFKRQGPRYCPPWRHCRLCEQQASLDAQVDITTAQVQADMQRRLE